MAWVQVRFEIQGEVQVARAFEASAAQVADLSEPLEEIAEHLYGAISEQFASEGAHGLGTRWTSLDPDYAAWKESVVGPGVPILVFSRKMRETLLDRAAVTITPQRLIYHPRGEHADVAAFHQGGDGVPQRKIVAITDAEKRAWERVFLAWLRRDVLFPGTRTAGL